MSAAPVVVKRQLITTLQYRDAISDVLLGFEIMDNDIVLLLKTIGSGMSSNIQMSEVAVNTETFMMLYNAAPSTSSYMIDSTDCTYW